MVQFNKPHESFSNTNKSVAFTNTHTQKKEQKLIARNLESVIVGLFAK